MNQEQREAYLRKAKWPQFPHCDAKVLHAPGECGVCDLHPEWQLLRIVYNIAFSGHTPVGDQTMCPAWKARGSSSQVWHGNRPSPRFNTVRDPDGEY